MGAAKNEQGAPNGNVTPLFLLFFRVFFVSSQVQHAVVLQAEVYGLFNLICPFQA